ncbi:hypothetical protein ACTFJJ_24460, partial [Enterobacter roggenkampii]|uniref:hypothetical protein n=1 Tax=Enterobacter roggenkampii TaxID=1812935 RepID=UPI003F75A840
RPWYFDLDGAERLTADPATEATRILAEYAASLAGSSDESDAAGESPPRLRSTREIVAEWVEIERSGDAGCA